MAREPERRRRRGRGLQVGLHVRRRMGHGGSGAGGQGPLGGHLRAAIRRDACVARRPPPPLSGALADHRVGSDGGRAPAHRPGAAPSRGAPARHHHHGPETGRYRPPGTGGPGRRPAAVLVRPGHLEPPRAVGRAGTWRGGGSRMGCDRQGGGRKRPPHAGGRRRRPYTPRSEGRRRRWGQRRMRSPSRQGLRNRGCRSC